MEEVNAQKITYCMIYLYEIFRICKSEKTERRQQLTRAGGGANGK